MKLENLIPKDRLSNDIKQTSHQVEIAVDYLMNRINQINQHNGWNDKPMNRGESITNIHAELSECWEWIKKGDGVPSDHIPEFTGEEEELADTIIRILHYGARLNLRLSGAIIAKLLFNINRSYRHGGKRF